MSLVGPGPLLAEIVVTPQQGLGKTPGNPARIVSTEKMAASGLKVPSCLPHITSRLTKDLVWLIKELHCAEGWKED